MRVSERIVAESNASTVRVSNVKGERGFGLNRDFQTVEARTKGPALTFVRNERDEFHRTAHYLWFLDRGTFEHQHGIARGEPHAMRLSTRDRKTQANVERLEPFEVACAERHVVNAHDP
jgi:hypothetical protein